MSKIRNLFKKIFKKDKSSQDLDEIFEEQDYYEEVTNIQNLPDELIEEEIDTYEEADIPEFEEQIASESIEEDDPQTIVMSDEEFQDEYIDGEYNDDEFLEDEQVPDMPINQDEYTASDIIGEHTATTEEELDLSDTSLTLKEKVEHFGVRFKDHFRSLRTKDLNQAFKRPDATSPNHKKIDLNKFKGKVSQINWNNLPAEFFSKARRNQYHKIFQLSLITVCFAVTVSLIAGLFQSETDYKNIGKSEPLNIQTDTTFSKDDLEQIKTANVFKTEQKAKAAPKKDIDKTQICSTATRKSSSNVKLVNTIVLQDSVKSLASVQVRSQKGLKHIREGEELMGQIKIDRIQNLKLIVKNLSSGECEYIENDQNKRRGSRSPIKTYTKTASKAYKEKAKDIKGIETDGTNFKIKKDFLKKQLSDINNILTQARGIPMRNPDGTYSFKIVDIEPGGVFAYLGVQDGDLITEINGEPIKDMNEVMNLFGRVSNLSKLNLTMKRSGESITQNYNIE